jgi:two-component system, chemotaxis family, sensor kinase CheA
MNTEKYKKLFLVEADEKINALNKALLGLEKKPGNLNFANDAMRAAHTMKSSAAAMGFMGISHLAHAMEDLFEQVRRNMHQLEPGALEILFENVDILSSAVKAIKNEKTEPDMTSALERLQKMQSSKGSGFSVQGESTLEPIEAIKVDVAVLDRLMNLTEELLVERMRLGEIVKSIESGDVDQKNLKSKILNLKSSSESFNRLFSDLQFNVVQARMVPLGQIFERFPRMVRDLAKEQKKEINLEMRGQEIELDRTIIDRLGEPLIHLLKNAVDHGIGNKGTIILSAQRERDKVLIKVENDGNSIDWGKIVEVAVRNGIIDEKKGKDLRLKIEDLKFKNEIINQKSEIENFLYLGRLSTSEKVTEVSGRGVGLSIVKTVVESFGGRVFIESPTDTGGARFTLQLPLTLAIIQALLVRVENQTFALPFSQIDRSVRVPIRNIKKAFDQEVAVVEEEDIPMVRLNKLFGLQKRQGIFLSEEVISSKSHQLKAELMVIAKKENLFSVGLVIDEMISEQDIVVKPFKGALKQSKGFAGVTLLGDGRPALILDVATLI